VVAVFDDRVRLLEAIRRLRTAGLEPETAFAPAYDEELIELAGRRSNLIGAMALAGAAAGCAAGFALTMWTTAQWPLIVGGKPRMSMPPFLLIVFELTLLLASLGAAAAFFRRAAVSRPDQPPVDLPDFTDARFGLLIHVDPVLMARTIETINQAGAVEWRYV
jgi:hypothetical protein